MQDGGIVALGETKVWQYVALTKRIYLIDCPGIVPATSDDFKQVRWNKII